MARQRLGAPHALLVEPVPDLSRDLRLQGRSRGRRASLDSPTAYYTTFFWGNNGAFAWQGGDANTYYGMHPYPVPAPTEPASGRSPSSAATTRPGLKSRGAAGISRRFASRVTPETTEHEFSDRLAGSTKVLTHTISSDVGHDEPAEPGHRRSARRRTSGPPPSLHRHVVGRLSRLGRVQRDHPRHPDLQQLPIADRHRGGDQLAEVLDGGGAAAIWYLNLDPRPSDVTDKKVSAAHNPQWGGTTALEWTSGASSPSRPRRAVYACSDRPLVTARSVASYHDVRGLDHRIGIVAGREASSRPPRS